MTIRNQIPYNLMIKMGRELVKGSKLPEEKPKMFLGFIDDVSYLMSGRKVDDFFTLFPPVKKYEDYGTWNYQSTLNFKNDLGEYFTEDSFKELLMTYCYENELIHKLGVGFMTSVSELHRQQTGKGVMEEFAIQRGLPIYQSEYGVIKPKLYLVEGGKSS